jgi:predicted ferric reductase
MVLFAESLILSARIPFFEPLFGGMNRVYIAHHILGGAAFLFLMVHPVSLAAVYIQNSWVSAALFLLPGQSWEINLGIASLLSLMALLIVTYYLYLPYELWRYTHKFLGAVFFLGILHTFFISSDISWYMPLRQYLLILSALGIVAFLYRSVFGRIFVPTYTYTVTKVHHMANDVVELILQPVGKRILNFVPGQFVFVTFVGPGIERETHPFSMSTPPMKSGFRLSIKTLGDYTSWLPNIPVGTTVRVEGPYGRFSYLYERNRSYIWIGGGIGITPFVSMAYSLEPGSCQADVYYATTTSDEAVYMPALTSLVSANPDLRVIPWYSKEQGRLTAELVSRTSKDFRTRDIFICGPPPMMHALKKQFIALGVPSGRIHMEEFGML